MLKRSKTEHRFQELGHGVEFKQLISGAAGRAAPRTTQHQTQRASKLNLTPESLARIDPPKIHGKLCNTFFL